MTLNAHDRALVDAALAGRTAAFDPAGGAEIHAEVIRDLLLGRTPAGVNGGVDGAGPAPRVSASGARIVGALDLRDLQRPDGTPLPSLELIDCVFERPLEFSHASLRRLSLAGSRFEHLDARDARFDGNVDLEGAGPPTSGGFCRVDLFGARVAGDVRAPRALLRAPMRPRHERDYETGDRWAALDLRMSRIEGDLALQPGFRGLGGVSLRGAHVAGSAWLGGATLEAGETFPLDAGAARIDGAVRLSAGIGADGNPAPFTARGTVYLWGVAIGGSLAMDGAVVEPMPPAPAGLAAEREPEHDYCGVTLTTASVGGGIDMTAATVTGLDGHVEFFTRIAGDVWIERATVRGGLDLSGTRVGAALALIGSRIDGDVTLGVAGDTDPAFDDIYLHDVEIGGALKLSGTAKSVRLDRGKVGAFVAIDAATLGIGAPDLEVGADVSLRLGMGEENTPDITFLDARIGGMFELSGAVSDLECTRVRVTKNFRIQGRLGTLSLADASIDGFLNLRVDAGPLNLQRLRVGSHCYLVGDLGDVDAVNAVIGGDLWLEATGTEGAEEPDDESIEADGAAGDGPEAAAGDGPEIKFLDAEIGGLVTLAGRCGEVNFIRASVAKSFETQHETGDLALTDGTIGGALRLVGKVGQVNLDRTRIASHCGIGAVSAGIRALDAHVGGDLWIGPDASENAEAVDVSFLDADVGGLVTLTGNTDTLNFERARVGKSIHVAGTAGAFWLKGASIGGDLWFKDTSSVESLNLIDTRVEANFGLFGSLGVPLSGDDAINGIALQVAGEVEISGATIHGGVSLRDTEVRQNFLVRRSALRGRFSAPRLHVCGNLEISASQFHDILDLSAGHVEGKLDIEDADLVWSGDLRRPAVVNLDDARIDSELAIAGLPTPGHRRIGRADELLARGGILRMRSLHLPFYPGWRLVEAVIDPAVIRELGAVDARGLNQPGVVGFLSRRPWLGGRGEVVLLTGSAAPIIELNARLGASFRLDTPAAAERYLQFQSTYLWGELGAYRAIQPGDLESDDIHPVSDEGEAPPAWQLEPITALRSAEGGEGEFAVRYSMRYGDVLYGAVAAVRPDGRVDMLDRDAIGIVRDGSLDRWISPFRFSADASPGGNGFPGTLGTEGEWRRERGRSLARLGADLRLVLGRSVKVVQLEEARADRLADRDGRGWNSEARLRLDGFTYSRAHSRPGGESNPLGKADRLRHLRRMRREDSLYRSTRMRIRRLHSHPALWLVELASTFEVDVEGSGRPDSYRRGTAAFVWTGAGTGHAIHLDGRSGLGAVLGGLPGRSLDSPEAVIDYLRMHCRLNRSERLLLPGDPALSPGAAPPAMRVELGPPEGAHRVEAHVIGPDGISECSFEIDSEGAVDCVVAAEPRPPHGGWREFPVGPFLSVDAVALHPRDFAGSPWGTDDWETLLPSDDADTRKTAGRILRDIVPVIRDRLSEDLEGGSGRLVEPSSGRDGEPSSSKARSGSDRKSLVHSFRSGSLAHGIRRLFGDPDGRTASRLRWLRLQYPDGRPDLETFHSHPYEVLAAALRNEGEDGEARRVLSEKLRIETRIEKWRRRPGRKLFNYFFGAFFDFGLSSGRALLSTATLLALGWAAIAWLNTSGLLVVDFTPSATMVVDSPGGGAGEAPTREMALAVAEPGRAEPRVVCGDNISNLVFAADYMVPILEFGQRHRCQVAGTRPPGARGWWTSPGLWQVAVTLYSVAGAVFVSITLLTVSGVLRRHAES